MVSNFIKISFYIKRFYNRAKNEYELDPENALSLDQVIQNDTFLIKLAGDGCKISQTHTNIFNFTFTIMNDIKNCMSVGGNFVLGKKKIFLQYNTRCLLFLSYLYQTIWPSALVH